MLLFDRVGKKGSGLYQPQGEDIFTLCTQEIVHGYNTGMRVLKGRVYGLDPSRIAYLNECFKFMYLSFLLFPKEQVVKKFFAQVKDLSKHEKMTEKHEYFEQFLFALVFF